MRFFDRILSPRRTRGASDIAYEQAMGVSADLIQKMQEYSGSNDAARAVMADIWAQRHNVPFMTSTYETVREMKAATTDLKQSPLLPK
jgi:hypothetical protein